MNSLTGEPILDFILQSGVVGAALFFMYRLMLKTLEKKGGNTQMMLHAARAFEAIEQRLNHHDTLLSHMLEGQNQMLRLMERQMTLLEQFGSQGPELLRELQSLKSDMAKVAASLDSKPTRRSSA